MKTSDIIVLAVPLNKETENLLSGEEFKLMKNGVIVVSISREKVVNKESVIKALEIRKVFGFGFDAEMATPIQNDDPFLKLDRVVITPHTASYTVEAEKGYIDYTIENVKSILEGKPIRVVNT